MKLSNPFRRPAEFITDRFILVRTPGPGQQSLHDRIRSLSFGRADAVRAYHVKKISDLMLLTSALLLLFLASFPLWYHPAADVPGEGIRRADYDQAPVQQDLLAVVEGESEAEPVLLDLHQRTFTGEQAAQLLQQAKTELENRMLGTNPSRDEVRAALDLPSTLQDGFVSAEYLMVPYGVVAEDGTVSLPEDSEGEVVEIRATLTCQEETLLYNTAVKVLPKLLSDREQWWDFFLKRLADDEQESREEEYFHLPSEVGGRQVRWQVPGRSEWKFLILLVLLIPPFVSFHRDEKIHSLADERRSQLLMDYPDLLWKLNMLLSAGLTIRSSLERIGSGYQEQRRQGQIRQRYAYEELLYTLREMGSGIAEAEAYLNFGKRCALPGYLKLGTLLEQNLKKGSAGLAKTLETEAEEAMEGRINAARKQGEQAGTKLLFPMIMMLGVVLAILMVPALMVMG